MDLLAHLACCLHVTHHASGADKLLDDQLQMTDNTTWADSVSPGAQILTAA